MPAAPAVAKKPTMYVQSTPITIQAPGPPADNVVSDGITFWGSNPPSPLQVFANRMINTTMGISGRYVATRATYLIPFSPTNAATMANTAAMIPCARPGT